MGKGLGKGGGGSGEAGGERSPSCKWLEETEQSAN